MTFLNHWCSQESASNILIGLPHHLPDRAFCATCTSLVPHAAKSLYALVCPDFEQLESSGIICPLSYCCDRGRPEASPEIMATGAPSDGFTLNAFLTHLDSTGRHSLACLTFDPRASDDT